MVIEGYPIVLSMKMLCTVTFPKNVTLEEAIKEVRRRLKGLKKTAKTYAARKYQLEMVLNILEFAEENGAKLANIFCERGQIEIDLFHPNADEGMKMAQAASNKFKK